MFDVCDHHGLTMIEIGEGYTWKDVKEATGCKFNFSSELQPMRKA